MFRGLSKYVLTADDSNHKGVQLRADGGFGSTPTMSSRGRAGGRVDVNTSSRSAREKVTSDARFEKKLMEDFVPYQNNEFMRGLARDMFFHDPISGQAVEMMSHLPFSEFEVAAVPDKEREKHVSSMNAMHMHELLPEIAQEEMVEGKHLSMMNFNESQGTFTGIIPFDPAACDLTFLPVYGRDPLVNVRIAPHMRELVRSQDSRVQSELENYADDVKNMVAANGSFPVPQEYLLYVARRAFSFFPEGISVFRRIAAVWLYEKNLFRGTLDMSSRKQKALVHAVVGDDEFIPTNEQLAAVGEMIVNAERNPVGAMIVTRPGLDIQEVGSNGCLIGSTLLSTENGLQRIDEIVAHDPTQLKKGATRTIDLKVKGIDGKLTKASRWYYQGHRDTINIYTSSGIRLTCTPTHNIQVVSVHKNASLDLIPANECEDQYVCIPQTQSGTNAPLPLTRYRDALCEKHFNEATDITYPDVMTPDLGYVMGMLVAEGTVNHKKTSVGNTDLDLLERYCDCFENVFTKRPITRSFKPVGTTTLNGKTYKTKECHISLCSSVGISAFLKAIGLVWSKNRIKNSAYYKEIPWSILEADKQSRLAFIAAYIDGDGSIFKEANGVAIRICSRSNKILRALHSLILDMGYYARVSYERYTIDLSTYSGTQLYIDIEPYLNVTKKVDTVGIVEPHGFGIPAEFFTHILESRFIRRQSIKKDGTPAGTWFTNDNGLPVFIAGSIAFLFRHHVSSKSPMSYAGYDAGIYKERLDIISLISLSLHANLVRLFTYRYRFEKVTHWTQGKKQHVYDISIADGKPNVFVANGIIVKNSDVWKIDESYDFFTTTKLRGLGLSDQIYGDFSVQSAENTLSSMIEKMVDIRTNITQRVLINRIALTIAVKNDFRKTKKNIEASDHDRRFMVTGSLNHRLLADNKFINPDDYNLPQIRYTKVLRLLSNSTLFESLNTLTQSGFPVPLRFLAAALGQSSDEYLSAYPEDVKIRKIISDYKAQLPKDPTQAAGGGDDDSAFSEASESVLPEFFTRPKPQKRNRNFEHLGVRDVQTGRLLTKKGQRIWDDKKNKLILQAAERVRDHYERKEKDSVEVKPKRYHHSRG